MSLESDTLFRGCRTGIQTEENGTFDLGILQEMRERIYGHTNIYIYIYIIQVEDSPVIQ